MNTDIKLTECYFIPDKKTSSATICANCGKEKYLHIIGEGVKAIKVNMNTTPMPHTDKQFPKSDADLKDESFARNEKKVFPYTDKQPQTVYMVCSRDESNTIYQLKSPMNYSDSFLKIIQNVLLHTPEELQALKAEWQREAIISDRKLLRQHDCFKVSLLPKPIIPNT